MLITLIFFGLITFSCSEDKQKIDSNSKAVVEKQKIVIKKGVFKIVGNEPFSKLVLITKEKHYYYITGKLGQKYRQSKYQGKLFEVEGSIEKKVLRTPNGIELVKLYLLPIRVKAIRNK